jgi:hypothetical protein
MNTVIHQATDDLAPPYWGVNNLVSSGGVARDGRPLHRLFLRSLGALRALRPTTATLEAPWPRRWIAAQPQLARRYDRRAATALGFLHLACTLIWLRFLQQAEGPLITLQRSQGPQRTSPDGHRRPIVRQTPTIAACPAHRQVRRWVGGGSGCRALRQPPRASARLARPVRAACGSEPAHRPRRRIAQSPPAT